MPLQTLQDIERAIEGLPAGARSRLEKWFYSHPYRYGNEESIDRVAEPNTAYRVDRLRMSPEEYLELEAGSDLKHEYVAGDIFAMSGASRRHNTISINLAATFRQHLRGGPCQAYMAEVKVRIRLNRDDFFYYPDVMVSCGSAGINSHYVEDPKLIVEVLSPSTERADRREKAMSYRQLPSLEEYALVAQDMPEITIYRRGENWLPQRSSSLESAVEFRSVALSLRLSQIYEGVTFLSPATTADPAS